VLGLTEPDAGSNPSAMPRAPAKTATSTSNGEKMWITSGSIADLAIIWARVENRGQPDSRFIVETDGPVSRPPTFTASGR